MKKAKLAIPVILAVMVLGTYVGSQMRGPKFKPHSIDYVTTSYDEDGTSTTSFLTRTVDEKGNWHHAQTMADGTVKEGRGKMSRLRVVESGTVEDRILDRPVVVGMKKKDNSSFEQFYSPDLQDDLRQVLRDANGRVMMTKEAIAIRAKSF